MKRQGIIAGCLLAAIAVIAASGCRRTDSSQRPVAVVSLEPQRYLLDQLVDGELDIFTVLPAGENPETYDPSPVMRQRVEDADIYFTTGYLLFEDNLELRQKSKTRFVNTSKGIKPVYGTHGHSHEKSNFLEEAQDEQRRMDADPHVWNSVKNAKVMVRNMAGALAEAYPEHAAAFGRRADAYVAHLDSLDEAMAATLDSLPTQAFMVWHPSLSYFARDYGLHQVCVGHETKEPSVNGLKRVIDEARRDSVRVFFYQSNVDGRQAETIGGSVGVQMLTIDPLAYDWENTLTIVADALAQ